MTEPMRCIHVVDDEPAILKALSRLFCSAGYQTVAYNSARKFMECCPPDASGCLVLDLNMPEVNGLELQRWLAQSSNHLPVIFLSGHADIATSVRAIKNGAVDFLTKPVHDQELLKAVEEAMRKERASRAMRAEIKAIRARLNTLTPREREVLGQVVSGRLNKQIAAELGTVEKTIKVHRARVMEKMRVQSLAELVLAAERVGVVGSISQNPKAEGRSPKEARRPKVEAARI